MNRTLRIAALVAAAGFLTACGSNVKLDDEASRSGSAPIESRGGSGSGTGDGATSGAAGGGSASSSPRNVEQVAVDAKDPLTDPNSPLAKRSIYFDYDSFVVKDEFRPTIDAHARYLLANRTKRIVIQGNTDERGSREYNLALGQKRSEAVRRALAALGVPDSQMEAVSFGEERPRATGADEAAYAENRRADLAYQ
ncbi:MAG: peptidoglycan-associated lipoprotein Pal [Burkholderiaceae bacterium]